MREFLILGSYFASIGGLLWLTSREWSRSHYRRFHILAFFALVTTWERMLSYFVWSHHTFFDTYASHLSGSERSIQLWLASTKLFREAWMLVTSVPETWVISQRICFATILWTLFLHKNRKRVPYTWAYLLLGELVAVSFAMNLYFSALLSASSAQNSETKLEKAAKRAQPPSSTLLFQCIAIALASTCLVNTVPDRYFLINLLVLHGVLFFPLLTSETTTEPPAYLYYVIHGLSAMHSLYCICRCHSLRAVYLAILGNPAMGSISFDVLMVTVSVALWNQHLGGLDTTQLISLSMAPVLQSSISQPMHTDEPWISSDAIKMINYRQA